MQLLQLNAASQLAMASLWPVSLTVGAAGLSMMHSVLISSKLLERLDQMVQQQMSHSERYRIIERPLASKLIYCISILAAAGICLALFPYVVKLNLLIASALALLVQLPEHLNTLTPSYYVIVPAAFIGAVTGAYITYEGRN
jgi:hypothetical protein